MRLALATLFVLAAAPALAATPQDVFKPWRPWLGSHR